jgi:hypothetical protein
MKPTKMLTILSLTLMTTVPVIAFTAAPAAANAPCSGLGAPIPNTRPTQYWNGCISATAGLNLRYHVGRGAPGPSTSDPWVMTLPYNTRVKIYCYLNGQYINGTPIWDAVGEFQEPGGLVSIFGPSPGAWDMATDAFIYTGSDAPVVPSC